MCKIANYADDSTLYSSEKNINNIMTSLNQDFAILSNWLHKNLLVLNAGKCSFMLFGVKGELRKDLISNNVTI